MASKIEKSAQTSGKRKGLSPTASKAALGTRNLDGASGLPLDFETTWLARLRGLQWVVKASEAGLAAAAAAPLPLQDETVARQISQRYSSSPRQRAFAQRYADAKAEQAEAALRALLILAQGVQPDNPARERLAREFAAATITTDRVGRAAERAHRVLALLLGEQGGVH